MIIYDIYKLPCKEIVPGYLGRVFHTHRQTYMYWSVQAGCEMPKHSHMHEQVAQVLEGKFELVVDGKLFLLEPGRVVVIPPYTLHGGRAISECRLLDVFTPVREDYRF